jgi:hypothetical protein
MLERPADQPRGRPVVGELAARELERDDRVHERLRGCMRSVSVCVSRVGVKE